MAVNDWYSFLRKKLKHKIVTRMRGGLVRGVKKQVLKFHLQQDNIGVFRSQCVFLELSYMYDEVLCMRNYHHLFMNTYLQEVG